MIERQRSSWMRMELRQLRTTSLDKRNMHDSFPTKQEFSRFHCYRGAFTHLLNESRITRSKTQARKTQKRVISHVSFCIWKIMRSSAYKWKLPNITEWNVDPESVKGLWIFGRTDGNLLHICFHNITEYDPDVVFDINVVFSALCSKFSSFDKK